MWAYVRESETETKRENSLDERTRPLPPRFCEKHRDRDFRDSRCVIRVAAITLNHFFTYTVSYCIEIPL